MPRGARLQRAGLAWLCLARFPEQNRVNYQCEVSPASPSARHFAANFQPVQSGAPFWFLQAFHHLAQGRERERAAEGRSLSERRRALYGPPCHQAGSIDRVDPSLRGDCDSPRLGSWSRAIQRKPISGTALPRDPVCLPSVSRLSCSGSRLALAVLWEKKSQTLQVPPSSSQIRIRVQDGTTDSIERKEGGREGGTNKGMEEWRLQQRRTKQSPNEVSDQLLGRRKMKDEPQNTE